MGFQDFRILGFQDFRDERNGVGGGGVLQCGFIRVKTNKRTQFSIAAMVEHLSSKTFTFRVSHVILDFMLYGIGGVWLRLKVSFELRQNSYCKNRTR